MMIRMKLNEKEAGAGVGAKFDNQTANTLTVNKESNLIVADFITGEGTSDSAYGGGTSVQTRSSRASASDIEFSESYL